MFQYKYDYFSSSEPLNTMINSQSPSRANEGKQFNESYSKVSFSQSLNFLPSSSDMIFWFDLI